MGDSNKNQALFSVIFEDDTVFYGGDNYKETKWLSIPNQKIKRIFYRLPDGNYLSLSGYDSYFHMVEVTQDWMKVGNRMDKINAEPII